MEDRTRFDEGKTELARRLGLALWGFLFACFALKLGWLVLEGPQEGDLPAAGGLALLEVARLVLITLSLSLIVYAYWIRRVPRVRAEGLAERWYPLLIAVLPFGYFFFRAPPPSPAMAVAGAVLCILGWTVTLWAFAHLRGSFSIMAEVRELVRGGPYAYVRHPLYLGEMINWIGLAVLYAGAPVAVYTAALIVMQAARAKIEERKLQASLGEAYGDYRRRAGFLWPRLLHRAWRDPSMSPSILVILTALLAMGCGRATVEPLIVYTSAEGDQLAKLQAAFESDNPGVTLKVVRYSTGVMTAKLLAERGASEVDVIWGLAASSMTLLAQAALLEPYRPAGFEAIPSMFKDTAEPPNWVGLDVWMVAICANTVELAARGLPIPGSWADLTDPRYRGQVVMPNPASSGAGYADVSGWLQQMGEEKAWAFMDALHQNIAQYTHSGSKPCKMAGAGEFALGISFDYRGLTQKQKGEPIEVVFPREGSGWELDTAAIWKGTKQLGAAHKLLDWAISAPAMRLYNEGYAIVALPGIAKPLPGMPPDPEKQLIRSDFLWAAQNRERILSEWTRRFDGKSEPKP